MKKLFCSLIAGLMFTSASLMAQFGSNSGNSETIFVTGKARAEKKADVAYLCFYVKSDGVMLKDLYAQLQNYTGTVVKAIKAKGGEKVKSVQVELLKIGEVDNRMMSSRADKTILQACNQVLVTMEPSLPMANEIVDAAIGAGAILNMTPNYYAGNNVNSSIVFGVEKPGETENELLKKAFEDAKSSAEKLAAVSGKKLGEVSFMGNYGGYIGSQFSNLKKYGAKYIGADPENINVEVSINVSFKLVNK
ncbi:MAG: hypothetical protein A2017_18670 [Lentisphaerae bacterium GWF2_44_16]|nr:MAG: hypothetical protein A2017_18670 [Lentisphaerae bacterium GWF2_44_16]